MGIAEAVKKAIEEDGFISRKVVGDRAKALIKPTDTHDCCIIHIKGREPGKRWNPTAGDLIADDWEVVKA